MLRTRRTTFVQTTNYEQILALPVIMFLPDMGITLVDEVFSGAGKSGRINSDLQVGSSKDTRMSS